jgi:hypothetical protein
LLPPFSFFLLLRTPISRELCLLLPWPLVTQNCLRPLPLMKAKSSSWLMTIVFLPTSFSSGPTPNTNEIIVSKAFFQWGFGLPTCDYFHGLLHHYKIKLVPLNLSSVLQVVIFVPLCEAYLIILPNFTLFKYNFFLKL